MPGPFDVNRTIMTSVTIKQPKTAIPSKLPTTSKMRLTFKVLPSEAKVGESIAVFRNCPIEPEGLAEFRRDLTKRSVTGSLCEYSKPVL
jgi:hypothetical protein